MQLHSKTAAFPSLNAFVEEKFDLKSVGEIFLGHLTSFLSEVGRSLRNIFETCILRFPNNKCHLFLMNLV